MFRHKKNFFWCGGWSSTGEAAQSHGWVSVPGDAQAAWTGPLATCFGWACFMQEHRAGDLQPSLPAPDVLWFSVSPELFRLRWVRNGLSSNMSTSFLVHRKTLGMGLYKPWLRVAFQFHRIFKISKHRAHLFPGCCCPQLPLALCVDSIGILSEYNQ